MDRRQLLQTFAVAPALSLPSLGEPAWPFPNIQVSWGKIVNIPGGSTNYQFNYWLPNRWAADPGAYAMAHEDGRFLSSISSGSIESLYLCWGRMEVLQDFDAGLVGDFRYETDGTGKFLRTVDGPPSAATLQAKARFGEPPNLAGFLKLIPGVPVQRVNEFTLWCGHREPGQVVARLHSGGDSKVIKEWTAPAQYYRCELPEGTDGVVSWEVHEGGTWMMTSNASAQKSAHTRYC